MRGALSRLEVEPGVTPEVSVNGQAGGPYNVYFYGADGDVSQPAITGDASGLIASGAASVGVVVTQEGGIGTDTRYDVQYVSQEQFASPVVKAGSPRRPPRVKWRLAPPVTKRWSWVRICPRCGRVKRIVIVWRLRTQRPRVGSSMVKNIR